MKYTVTPAATDIMKELSIFSPPPLTDSAMIAKEFYKNILSKARQKNFKKICGICFVGWGRKKILAESKKILTAERENLVEKYFK